MTRTTQTKSPLAAAHPAPFKESKVSGMQIYLIALAFVGVIAVALSFAL